VVQPDDEETNAIQMPAIFLALCVDLGIGRTLSALLEEWRNQGSMTQHTAMADMKHWQLTGIGQLKTILDLTACWVWAS
jgi:uncharacterized protein (DUF1786 family)